MFILLWSRPGGAHPENVYPCQEGAMKPLPSLAQNLRNPTLTGTKFHLRVSCPACLYVLISPPCPTLWD